MVNRRVFLVALILGILVSYLYSNVLLAYEEEIKNTSEAIAEALLKSGTKTVAVVDFTDLQGNVTELGRFIAEEMSVALASTDRGFQVVDRIHLIIILQEHKFAMTGLIDPSTAKKLGKIAGVEALVTGTLTPFGETVRFSCRILETETAKIIAASTADIPKTKAIEELLQKSISTDSLISNEISREKQETHAKVEKENFIFEVRRVDYWESNVQTLTFYLIITNKIRYREFHIIDARMIDNLGNVYTGLSGAIPSQLDPGVPREATIQWQRVWPKPRNISLLEVRCKSDGMFTVKFQNLPLEN